MKEALVLIGRVLGALLLIVVAIALLIVLIPVAFIWKLVVSVLYDKRKARDILTGTAKFFLAIAISLDKFGNVAYGGFFNNVLLSAQIYRFGATSETVSEVLGWAYKYDDLTPTGLLLRKVVNKIDWTEVDHCEAARLSAVENALVKLQKARQFRIYKMSKYGK